MRQAHEWNGKNGDGLDAKFFNEDRFHLELATDVQGMGTFESEEELIITDLTYRHRPIVRIARGEISEPVSVNFMMNRAHIFEWVFKPFPGVWIPEIRARAPVTFADMRRHNDTAFWFGYNNERDRFKPPPGEYVVYHISFVAENHVFVQYWFFLATSYLPTGNAPDIWWHEGDWEMLQFVVKLNPEEKDIDKKLEPFAATASQHYYGQTLKWKRARGDNPPANQNQDYVQNRGMRPVIFVAQKSHAIYFRAGAFKTASGSPRNPQFQYGIPGALDTLLDVTTTGRIKDTTGDELKYIAQEPIINRWKGFWGMVNQPGAFPPAHGDGPPSPKFRGPAEQGGPVLIQSDPKGFHNAYLKRNQQDIRIR